MLLFECAGFFSPFFELKFKEAPSQTAHHFWNTSVICLHYNIGKLELTFNLKSSQWTEELISKFTWSQRQNNCN